MDEIATRTAANAVPAGFRPVRNQGPYIDGLGPIYFRKAEDGRVRYGIFARDCHVNPAGIAHGGFLYTFADQIIGVYCAHATRRGGATLKMVVEYLAPARPGDWIEGEVEVSRTTRTMSFLSARLYIGGRIVLSADGIWKLSAPFARGRDEGA